MTPEEADDDLMRRTAEALAGSMGMRLTPQALGHSMDMRPTSRSKRKPNPAAIVAKLRKSGERGTIRIEIDGVIVTSSADAAVAATTDDAETAATLRRLI